MEHHKKNPEIKMCLAELQVHLHKPSPLGQPILEQKYTRNLPIYL